MGWKLRLYWEEWRDAWRRWRRYHPFVERAFLRFAYRY